MLMSNRSKWHSFTHVDKINKLKQNLAWLEWLSVGLGDELHDCGAVGTPAGSVYMYLHLYLGDALEP